ncbi:MAG: hypothetical protein M1827_003093 [Pycnora praestabilis]|nr:MAG: hypothetical protein M1827_003093 [Pycnora praestabilis]
MAAYAWQKRYAGPRPCAGDEHNSGVDGERTNQEDNDANSDAIKEGTVEIKANSLDFVPPALKVALLEAEMNVAVSKAVVRIEQDFKLTKEMSKSQQRSTQVQALKVKKPKPQPKRPQPKFADRNLSKPLYMLGPGEVNWDNDVEFLGERCAIRSQDVSEDGGEWAMSMSFERDQGMAERDFFGLTLEQNDRLWSPLLISAPGWETLKNALEISRSEEGIERGEGQSEGLGEEEDKGEGDIEMRL